MLPPLLRRRSRGTKSTTTAVVLVVEGYTTTEAAGTRNLRAGTAGGAAMVADVAPAQQRGYSADDNDEDDVEDDVGETIPSVVSDYYYTRRRSCYDQQHDNCPTRKAEQQQHQHHHHTTTTPPTVPQYSENSNNSANSSASGIRIRDNFAKFSLWFAANHAAGLACLALATAQLGDAVGSTQTATLYLTYTASALLAAVPAASRCGSKNAAVVGMSLFCLYVVSFLMAAVAANAPKSWIPVAGAAVGGAGAGVAWTAQGVYFAETVQRLRQLQLRQQEEEEAQGGAVVVDGANSSISIIHADGNRGVTTTTTTTSTTTISQQLAATFAVCVLTMETALDAAATVLVEFARVPWSVVFAVYAATAVISTIALHCTVMEYNNTKNDNDRNNGGDDAITSIADADTAATEDLGTLDNPLHHPQHQQHKQSSSSSWLVAWNQVTAALRLLVTDSKMKYLLGFNAAFALAGAFLNSFVSGQVVEAVTGDDDAGGGGGGGWVGLLVALHGVAAAAGAWILGRAPLATAISKEWILVAGAVAFALVALPFAVWPSYRHWSWPLLVWVYAVEGAGRATFEGTLKALFADYFGYAKEGAFANIILQYGLVSAAAYFGSTRLHCTPPPSSSSSPNDDSYCVEYRDGSHHNVLAFALLVMGASVVAIAGIARAAYLFHNAPDPDAFADNNKHALYHHEHNHRPSLTPLQYHRPSSNGLFALRRKTYQAVELELTEPDYNSDSFVQRELPNVT